jgi:AcrR family transcriptional regulator
VGDPAPGAVHNLKELRPRVGGASEVRLLFVFDAAREAIILVAGDKAGRWSGWYANGVSQPTSRAAKRAATAQRILDAARAEFGERGLEATTIRRIAQRAHVDPSLVMQHYGSKAALFAIAIQLEDAGPDEVAAHLHDVLDVRLQALPPETKALVRSMLTAPEAAASMSVFLNERAANLSRAMGGEDADLRAALIVSSILGLTIARHFLKLDAFTRASDSDIARVARPWVTTGVDPASGPGQV